MSKIPRRKSIMFLKKRKKRGLKKSGYKSYDLCPYCFARGCDPGAYWSSLSYNKRLRRLLAGLCPACGQNPCKCKSYL